MPPVLRCKYNVLPALSLFLLLTVLPLLTSAAASSSPRAIVSTLGSCPSLTVNYITHRLPQQCAKTSWTGGGASSIAISKEDGAAHTSGQAVVGTPAIVTGAPAVEEAVSDSSEGGNLSSNSGSTVHTTYNTADADFSASVILASSETDTEEPHTKDMDGDSPLDNSKFLSFEDWKKQMLAKMGQSNENVGSKSGSREPRRRPANINNALDSLGDDTEIDLDFGGFVTESGEVNNWRRNQKASGGHADNQAEADEADTEALTPPIVRSKKDTGTTGKGRFNYASFDCAATVLKTNPQAKSSTSVLVENKDSYMLNPCSVDNKFLIIELCETIQVDTVVLANFEFFSSIFRTFRVSVADKFPTPKRNGWKELGTYEARNSRQVQAFAIENPLIWARYLRVEFLSHYGGEFYCPVSLVRVHGTTMIEEFNYQDDSRGEEEIEDEDVAEVDEQSMVTPSTVGNSRQQTAEEEVLEAKVAAHEGPSSAESTNGSGQMATPVSSPRTTISSSAPQASPTEISTWACGQPLLYFSFNSTDVLICFPSDNPLPRSETGTAAVGPSPPVLEPRTRCSLQSNPEESSSTTVPVGQPVDPVLKQAKAGHDELDSSKSSTENQTASPPSNSSPSSSKSADGTANTHSSASADTPKAPPSITQPHHPNPTTQESFFKTLHKRLQLLESNATLSLQYIEEQSLLLRAAFQQVEQRQLSKATLFLDQLNSTVLSQLLHFRQQYDQIWQSTVLELENQRQESAHEILAVTARLGLLADEVIFQKRLSMIQSVLLLLSLGLVIFSRVNTTAPHLELPIVRDILARSQRSWGLESPLSSPSGTRPVSRHQMPGHTHTRNPSDASTEGLARSPTLEFSPPTPTSDTSFVDTLDDGDHSRVPSRNESPNPENAGLRAIRRSLMGAARTQSSPAVPTGSRGLNKSPNPNVWYERGFEAARILKRGALSPTKRGPSLLRRGQMVGDEEEEELGDEMEVDITNGEGMDVQEEEDSVDGGGEEAVTPDEDNDQENGGLETRIDRGRLVTPRREKPLPALPREPEPP